MLDRLTSTWVILLFLLGAMIVASFLPSNTTTAASQLPHAEIGLEGDVLNRELFSAGTTNKMVQSN